MGNFDFDLVGIFFEVIVDLGIDLWIEVKVLKIEKDGLDFIVIYKMLEGK